MPPTLKKLVGHIALGLSVCPCVKSHEFVVMNTLFYAPNFKKLVGHIALGLSVCPCVRTTFFLTFKRWMLVS